MSCAVVLVAVSGDHVLTFEAWGAKALLDKDHDALEKAAASLAR